MKKKKILVVEDERLTALEIKEDLEEMGIEVPEVVDDADSVTAAYVRHRPDLVIMDIKLFGFRVGIDAADQIHAFYSVPIIFLTSSEKAEVRSRLRQTKQKYFLHKPYDREMLAKAIAKILSTVGTN